MPLNVMLTATGRRTGQPREVQLYAFPDGDRLVIVGSRGGSAIDPRWADNLRAEPRATIRRGRVATEVRAHEVEGEERERLWGLVCEAFPMYASYQRKTKRTIPIFVLESLEASARS